MWGRRPHQAYVRRPSRSIRHSLSAERNSGFRASLIFISACSDCCTRAVCRLLAAPGVWNATLLAQCRYSLLSFHSWRLLTQILSGILQLLASLLKRALLVMQYPLSDLGVHAPQLCRVLLASPVQPVFSNGCEVWCLDKPYTFQDLNTVHTQSEHTLLARHTSLSHTTSCCASLGGSV